MKNHSATSAEGPEALEAAVERVATLLLVRIGLRADPGLPGRLRRAIRDGSQQTAQDYAGYVDSLASSQESLQMLLNRVTVQETAFFRHPQHFDVLARDVLPTLTGPVKIWSAACSNGQEAFSLAMLLKEQGVDGSVVATDLSTDALQRTAAGRYRGRELSGLSPERMSAHLTRSGDGWTINRSLRDRVSTFRHNLIDPLPAATASAQVIFCRNVLIYLSPAHAQMFLARVADTFSPQSTLFLGAAETIWQMSDRLEAIPVRDTFLYRRKGFAAPLALRVAVHRPIERSGPSALRRPSLSDPQSSPPPSAHSRPATTRRAPEPGAVAEIPTGVTDQPSPAAVLATTAQTAFDAGDFTAAIVAFRKCVYLSPNDPVAQLHLGLALEAAGQQPSARRAYTAARRTLIDGAAETHSGIKGFAPGELVRLLDSKLRVHLP